MSPPDVRTIDAASIASAEEFNRDVVQHCMPVVLRGLVRDWPLLAHAQQPSALIDYLTSGASRRPIGVFIGAADIKGRYYYNEDLTGFNFRQETLAFPDAVQRVTQDRLPTDESAYLGSVPLSDYLPDLTAANPMPILATPAPRLWLGHAAHIATHYDTMDNLACVFLGARRFTLYPPDAISDLYVGPIDFTMAGQPVSLAAEIGGDPKRYPRFEAARDRALIADLKPGDALYLPKLWWHQVVSTEPINGLINYWWDAFAYGPDTPNLSLMFSMINISERPLPERMAWRAFFDHYVFRPEGHPLMHLPSAKHGILGALHPDNYGRIRARIMHALRGHH